MLALLGKFNEEYFAYFEVYWAKVSRFQTLSSHKLTPLGALQEDPIGAYYNAGDYDRGRHFLVGEARFRGPHRVRAWGASLIHYLFLDDSRTSLVVEEPKAANSAVLAYDYSIGFNIEKLIDLPHKRSALEVCSRERFFQLSPFHWEQGERAPNVGQRASRL